MKKKKEIIEVAAAILFFALFSYALFKWIPLESILGKSGTSILLILVPFISIFGSNIITSSFLYPILFFLKANGVNLPLLIILAAIGGTIGDSIFVYFGKKISIKTENREGKIFHFFEKRRYSHYIVLLIFLYAAFFPMSNEFMTLALGYLKYPFKKIITPLTLGNMIYYTILIIFGSTLFQMIF